MFAHLSRWVSAVPQPITKIHTLTLFRMDLPQLLQKKQKELTRYIQRDAPRIIGKQALQHTQEAFTKEGFTDHTLSKWPEVERRKPLPPRKDGKKRKKKSAYNRRKILHGTGNLKRSFSYQADAQKVEISSDSEYAAVHNYGTDTAGRNRNVSIPKRMFLSPTIPAVLKKTLVDKFTQDITTILAK